MKHFLAINLVLRALFAVPLLILAIVLFSPSFGLLRDTSATQTNAAPVVVNQPGPEAYVAPAPTPKPDLPPGWYRMPADVAGECVDSLVGASMAKWCVKHGYPINEFMEETFLMWGDVEHRNGHLVWTGEEVRGWGQ